MGSIMTKIHLILEKKNRYWGRGPLKINPIIFFAIFFKKYKICRTFWYKVYWNRIKIKISGQDSARSACTLVSQWGGAVTPSRADLRFFEDIKLNFLYNFLEVKNYQRKKKNWIWKKNGLRRFSADMISEKIAFACHFFIYSANLANNSLKCSSWWDLTPWFKKNAFSVKKSWSAREAVTWGREGVTPSRADQLFFNLK